MTLVKSISCENCSSLERGIFCDLEHGNLTKVSKHKVVNRYKKGQTIFFQGNPPFGLYCVNSGKIKISKIGNEGKESILRIVGPGDVIGHRSLFSKENYNASATAIEDTIVCFLDKTFILSAIKADPSISLNLIQKLSQDMGQSEVRNTSMSQKNARERLAELFLTFEQKYGENEGGRCKLNIKLNREEIASLVGTAHETIIRLISEFKDEGIIEQEGKILFITNRNRLIDIANLDY